MTMAEAVRIAPLLRACLEVLREASEPLHGREVLERAARRVSLTAYEQEPIDDRGQPRWQNHLRWYTGDVATVGWMSKRDGFWSLTEAGETALDAYDEEEFLAELKRRYNEIRRQRANAAKALSNVEQLITRALSVVDPGSWTAYDDLAELVDASADDVQHFLAGAKRGLNGGYRVLYRDGSLPADGMRHMDHRGMNLARKLKTEGVEFDDQSQASQAQRMTAADIEQRLAELGDVEPDKAAIRRAWLVRGSSVDGRDLVTVWLQKSTASLAASNLRQISPPLPRDELKTFVEQDYQHKSYAVRESKLAEFDAFCNRMRPGDYILTTSRGQTFLGRITSDVISVQSSDQRSNLRRMVDWLNPTRPVPFAKLPEPLPAKLHSQSDVVELTENITAIEALLNELGIAIDEPAPAPERELSFREITDELAIRLLIDRNWLQKQADLLWDRKQVIFYGPPGTGKTFVARELAGHLAEPNAVKLVQFHPAYTYEDFFEGFRPVSRKDGQLTFELKSGPFRTLVDAARDHPSDPYILIIDEINRANLAKVFGELYFLLEYRDQAISLLYSGSTDFTLPPNVFLIGTMNTSDRTLALLDAAMRRRFAFVELHPSEPPISGLLTAWLNRLKETTHVSHNLNAPELLNKLNSRIEDRDLAIGPSFLMHPEIYRREDGLNRAWENSILPLLAEHHYGGPPSVLNRYRLTSLRGESATDEDRL